LFAFRGEDQLAVRVQVEPWRTAEPCRRGNRVVERERERETDRGKWKVRGTENRVRSEHVWMIVEREAKITG